MHIQKFRLRKRKVYVLCAKQRRRRRTTKRMAEEFYLRLNNILIHVNVCRYCLLSQCLFETGMCRKQPIVRHTHTTRNAYLYYFTFINKLCFIATYNKRNETYRKFTFLHFLRITFVSGDGGSEIGRIECIRPNECDE